MYSGKKSLEFLIGGKIIQGAAAHKPDRMAEIRTIMPTITIAINSIIGSLYSDLDQRLVN